MHPLLSAAYAAWCDLGARYTEKQQIDEAQGLLVVLMGRCGEAHTTAIPPNLRPALRPGVMVQYALLTAAAMGWNKRRLLLWHTSNVWQVRGAPWTARGGPGGGGALHARLHGVALQGRDCAGPGLACKLLGASTLPRRIT